MNKLIKNSIFGVAFVFAFMLFGMMNVYAEQITVKTLDGDKNEYEVDLENTQIGDFKEIIATEKEIDFRKIALIFAGKELDNDKTFSFYNIQKETTLHLVIRNFLSINAYGDGQIAYAKEDKDLVYSDEISSITKEKGTYKIGAKANEESEFVRWILNDKEYSTDPEITLTLDDEDIELIAIFQSTKTEEYNVDDYDGNIISFTAPEGEIYNFDSIDIMTITDEDLQELVDIADDSEYTFDILKEQLDKVTSYGKKAATAINGDLLKLYEMYLSSNGTYIHEIDGGFKIKLKITDDIKGYDSYKLIYIDDDGTTEDAIELTQNGDYLEGVLEHLSMYALVGSKTENVPSTGDNIVFYISMLGLSVIALIGVALSTKKKRFN